MLGRASTHSELPLQQDKNLLVMYASVFSGVHGGAGAVEAAGGGEWCLTRYKT